MEKSTTRKPHDAACKAAKIKPFTLYTLRHTCLTRWAPHMDPWTLAYLAGHADMSTTRKYVHPQTTTIQAALSRVSATTAAEQHAVARVVTIVGTAEKDGQDAPPEKTLAIN